LQEGEDISKHMNLVGNQLQSFGEEMLSHWTLLCLFDVVVRK